MKINVAITMNVQRDATQSIWYNGANQHCVYLYMLLKSSPLIGEVWLAHDDGIAEYPQALMMDAFGNALRPLSAIIH